MRLSQLVILFLLLSARVAIAQGAEEYFVFVGEKISFEHIGHHDYGFMRDSAFAAKYRILEPFKGAYDESEIEFTVYDHYGTPAFLKYDHVLLYVERHNGRWYHSKYLYTPLYRTVDGEWAGPYQTYDYTHEYNKNTEIKPALIEFAEPVSFDVSNIDQESIERWYPEPYYRIENGKAIAVYGNYLEELFLLKQRGVLKARGDFQSF